ncbi:unnamed protein product [Oikopleura dioica]|uniref:Uncharacterized protein n=1 Tax=Oikopleura dioica TaxID=34765 RepID=E4YPN7_OIKDI|nr:unnamed protein product [Oikopleura dioica]
MVEIDSSDLLSLDELYLLRNLDEEKQKYEDMKEEINENLKRQLRREKKINELEITVAELHKSRLEERKLSISKKITEFVRTDLDDCAEIKNILKKLADRQPKIQELKLKQKSLDEELKLIIESDEPGTIDQTKNLERSHAVLSIVAKARSVYSSIKENTDEKKGSQLGSQLVAAIIENIPQEKRLKVEEGRRRSISSVDINITKENLSEALKKIKNLKRG